MASAPRIFPQDFPVRRIMRTNSAVVENQNLRHAGQGRQPRRTVASAISASAPNKLSCGRPIGDERATVSATGANYYEFVEDKRRTTDAPFISVAAIILHDVLRPNQLATLQVQTVQNS